MQCVRIGARRAATPRSPGGEVPCTAPTLRNDVSKCAGTAEVVLATAVSLEEVGVNLIGDA